MPDKERELGAQKYAIMVGQRAHRTTVWSFAYTYVQF